MEPKKIILVDDQASYRKTVKNILDIIGGAEIIAEASSGEEYLELLKKHKPDITFMDIEMPGIDGIETTRKALAKDSSLVIIGLSMYANEDYIKGLINVGARGYLLKLSNNYKLFEDIIKHPTSDIFYSKQAQEISQSNKSKRSVLLVDDFETNVIVISAALKTANFDVIKTTDPNEALREALKAEHFDLMIVDYNMPGMTGAELIQKIKQEEKFKNTPALILSSDNSPEKKNAAKEAGAAGWIKKPFQLGKFLKIIQQFID
ncbi:MAG: response regulator [Bacteroidota bacterium]|nr:response regulator [Bacteroidota bacterium]